MVRITPESKVKNDVTDALRSLTTTGDVLYFQRMNAGMVSVGKHFMRLSENGHFDMIALFRDKQGHLAFAFIELKRADRAAKLGTSQEVFKAKYDGKHPNIFFWLVQSGAEVRREIMSRCYNRVNDIKYD